MKSKIFVIILGISVFIGILAFARYSINQSVNTQETNSLVVSTSNKPYAKKSNRIDGQYPVKEIVDGDTIKVLINKKIITIRILGIDTPETFITRTGYRECYGQEASDFAKKELTGKTVTIETDSSQDQIDKYGRVLAHVFYSGSLYYEEESIRNGYGFRYVYKKPTRYDDRLIQAETIAKTNLFGVWKYCWGKRTDVKNTIIKTKKAVDDLLNKTESSPLLLNPTFPVSTVFSCDVKKRYCSEMKSCDEVQFYWHTCQILLLDQDTDDSPCEAICK